MFTEENYTKKYKKTEKKTICYTWLTQYLQYRRLNAIVS